MKVLQFSGKKKIIPLDERGKAKYVPPVDSRVACNHPYYQDGKLVARCTLPHGSEHAHGTITGVEFK